MVLLVVETLRQLLLVKKITKKKVLFHQLFSLLFKYSSVFHQNIKQISKKLVSFYFISLLFFLKSLSFFVFFSLFSTKILKIRKSHKNDCLSTIFNKYFISLLLQLLSVLSFFPRESKKEKFKYFLDQNQTKVYF